MPDAVANRNAHLRARREITNLRAFVERLTISEHESTSRLAWAWRHLGKGYEELGRLASARECYETFQWLCQQRIDTDPNDLSLQRDLSVSLNKIGDVKAAQGDLNGALDAFQQSLTIRQRLAEADPGNAGWQRDLSISHERIANTREDIGDSVGAEQAWRNALTVSLPLAERYPDHIPIRTTPVVHLAGAVRTLLLNNPEQVAEARRLLRQALELIEPLEAAGQLDTTRSGWPNWIRDEIAALTTD